MVIEADHRLESDSSLVAQAASGDESAYKALYERHHQHLLAVLRASVPAPLAEEAAQEAWARAYERIHSLDKPQAFFAWLSTIARNYARDHHRSTGSESLSLGEDHDWIPEPAPGPDTLVEHDEDRRFAARALQRLPDKQRAALVLRNLQGRSYVSIAGRLGLSVSATETLLHRARSNFQREYSSLQSGIDTPALACYKMRSSLRALASGGLSDLRRMRVIAHLESCGGCRSTHDEMRRTRRIAGFIPFFLPIAWLRDKFALIGKTAIEGTSKFAAASSAGTTSLGFTPLAMISGGLAVATISGGLLLGATVFHLPGPFLSNGEGSGEASVVTDEGASDVDRRGSNDDDRPIVAGISTGDHPAHTGSPRGSAAPQGTEAPIENVTENEDVTQNPPQAQSSPEESGTAVCTAADCSQPPSGCQANCDPPPLPGDPCADDPASAACQPPDPCETNPQAAGCGGSDPCAANPNAPGCDESDPCVLDPTAPECGGDGGGGGGSTCQKPGQGSGHGYGYCQNKAQRSSDGDNSSNRGRGNKTGHSR